MLDCDTLVNPIGGLESRVADPWQPKQVIRVTGSIISSSTHPGKENLSSAHEALQIQFPVGSSLTNLPSHTFPNRSSLTVIAGLDRHLEDFDAERGKYDSVRIWHCT